MCKAGFSQGSPASTSKVKIMSLKSIIESLLFMHGAPLPIGKLARITGESEDAVRLALQELERDYTDRGLVLLKKDDEVELGSSPENAKFIEALIKSEFTEGLSKAAAETLAIVAYKGPLTRNEIEFIRGVNASFILRNLLMRGLVERIENPKDARAYLYRVSFDFLKFLGVSSVEELPGFLEYRKEKLEIPHASESHPWHTTEAAP